MNPGEAPSAATPDEFEIALRTWSAHDKIITESYAIAEIVGLDPVLVERMQREARGDNAGVAMREAACDLLEAVEQELVVRSS
jgi:hypothetical protein